MTRDSRKVERTKTVVSAAERLSVGTLVLQVGGLGETVTVEASGTHVNTAETQHSGLITAKQIEQIQVRSRDVTALMRLASLRPAVDAFFDQVMVMAEDADVRRNRLHLLADLRARFVSIADISLLQSP